MCVAAIFAAAAMTAAAQTTISQEAASADQALVDQGKTTYAEKCSHCHGPGLLNPGTVTPDLREFPDEKHRFFAIVKEGRNNRMPPWADLLSDDQIGTLWVYISSRRKP
jgi:cytochrome c55X